MPGNAGRAKGPDFWRAFEDGEVVAIGDEPANTNKDRSRRRLLCRAAKGSCSPCQSRVRLVCLRVPRGEASWKAGCRKSAPGLMSGMGNGAWPLAPSYRAHPRLYLVKQRPRFVQVDASCDLELGSGQRDLTSQHTEVFFDWGGRRHPAQRETT